MRRALTAIVLVLAAAAAALGQTNADEARRELNLGARAYRDGRFAEAEQHFRRVLELDPTQKNAPIFIARAVQQQYKPGVQTPENIAAGERAVAAYQDILAKDPANDDAYRAIVYLYGQMKNEDKVNELLLWRANDFSAPNEKRAEAFVILASKQWQCSYDVTEQKENKTTESVPDKVVIHYKMPADAGDFIRARQCMTEGLQLVEQAITLAPKNPNAWSYKANLLREGAKLAEMEGDATQKAEYERQHEEALATQKVMGEEDARKREAEGPGDIVSVAPVPPAKPSAPGAKRPFNGGILNGKAVSRPMPAYPPEAKAAGAKGTVVVRVVVDESGKVIEAEAVSGDPLLRQSAVTAARHARFTPTILSGVPVKVAGVITYNFVPQ